MDIIQDSYIDEEEAKNFLQNLYEGIDLLPGVPEKLTVQDAAAVLNVSIPTIDRMVQDGQLKFTKKNIIQTVMNNFLSEKSVFEDEEIEPEQEENPIKNVEKKTCEKVKIAVKEAIQGTLFPEDEF